MEKEKKMTKEEYVKYLNEIIEVFSNIKESVNKLDKNPVYNDIYNNMFGESNNIFYGNILNKNKLLNMMTGDTINIMKDHVKRIEKEN